MEKIRYYKFNEEMLDDTEYVSYYYISNADVISALYKALSALEEEGWNFAAVSLYLTPPRFNDRKLYGLCIDFDDRGRPFYYALSEHQILGMILDHSIVEWECERGC